jgi:2-C-methyl-D-erythritol 4-phosphate cytidylyltransferase
MTLAPRYNVVVPAAGIGKRMQADCPKQYLKIAGKTVIEHTLNNLLKHPSINQVIVVLNAQDQTFKQLSIADHPAIKTVLGGKERCDSVLAGLNFLSQDEQWVLVHDAARPCLAQTDLTALLQLAELGNKGGILATPVRDTMKRGQSSKCGSQQIVKHTESRENLWHALTPQFFQLAVLKQALEYAMDQQALITDEASAVELLGKEVVLIAGKASNIKITQPEDLLLAEFYLTQANINQEKT